MRAKQLIKNVIVSLLIAAPLTVCGSNSSNNTNSDFTRNLGVTSGAADTHCQGVTPKEANVCVTGQDDSMDSNSMDSNAMDSNSMDSNTMDSNSMDSNGMVSDYGETMYGSEADDDDCKYHVKWAMNATAQNTPVTFKVTATRLVEKDALTGAAARAEVFLPSKNIYAPATSPAQSVVEDPPGTYTISPVVFNASGVWTVRFHFYELCSDTEENSKHGHAAFNVTIP